MQVDLVPRLFEVIGPKVDIHTVEGVSLIGLPPVRPTRSRVRSSERWISPAPRCCSSFGSRVRGRGLLIKLDSKGPVFFRQERLGRA